MIDIPKAKADAEEGLRIAEPATKGPWHKADCVSPKIVIYAVPQGPHGFGDIKTLYLGETYCDQKGQGRANLAFIADSRTRAPEAYRNVVEMAEEIETLRAQRSDLESRFAELSADHHEEHGRLVAFGVERDDLLEKIDQITADRDRTKATLDAAEASLDEAISNYERSIAARERDLVELRGQWATAKADEETTTRTADDLYERAVMAEAERDALRLDVVRLRSENEKHLEQSWAFETEIEQLREQLDKYVDVKFAKDVS